MNKYIRGNCKRSAAFTKTTPINDIARWPAAKRPWRTKNRWQFCNYLIRLTIFAAALLIASSLLSRVYADDTGKQAPNLVVKQLDGALFNLSALRGKVVVVNFWATWCPPCKAEMPALDAVYAHYNSLGVSMIGLSADRKHDRKEVIKIGQTVHYPIAMLVDAGDNGFGAPGTLPVTYVIDDQGIVRARLDEKSPAITAESLSKLIEALLPASKLK